MTTTVMSTFPSPKMSGDYYQGPNPTPTPKSRKGTGLSGGKRLQEQEGCITGEWVEPMVTWLSSSPEK